MTKTAETPTIKTERIRAGLYEYTDKYGREWAIEHIGPGWTEHTYDEWAYGCGNDRMASQTVTKREAIAGIAATLADDAAHECECGGLVDIDTMTFRNFYCRQCKQEYTPEEYKKLAVRREILGRTNELLSALDDDVYYNTRVLVHFGNGTITATFTDWSISENALRNKQYTNITVASLCRLVNARGMARSFDNGFIVSEYRSARAS